MHRLSGWALVVALGVAASACDDDRPTSVSLEMTTTLACADFKGAIVSVTTAGVADERSLDTTRCTDGVPEARIGTVLIVPGSATDALITLRIVAGFERPASDCTRANGYAGCIVARRTLRFVPGRELDLPVVLRRECASIACDEVTTCVKGTCRSALIEDPLACTGVGCNEGALAGPSTATPIGPSGPDGDAGAVLEAGHDGGVTLPIDGGLICAPSEKICDGKCVSSSDPIYGCLAAGCSACPGIATGDYKCAGESCALVKCKTNFKQCGGACIGADISNGCGSPSCTPCDATNGTASCKLDAVGKSACSIACKAGFKSCGGKCVSVNDPTYGCSPSQCSAASCPAAGGGTLACVGGACVIGTCPAGTKNCGQKCVPTDAQNGCQDPLRCTACGQSDECLGTPSVCTCVPQSRTTTCAGKACGPAVNNCGQTVQCPTRCQFYDVCGGGGAGPNGCGCTSDPACAGRNCGFYYDNCGRGQDCGGCSWPSYCGGGGNQVCGATAEGNCGPSWPTMGTFRCDSGRRLQKICGCMPPLYSDPAFWAWDGGDCYEHLTGEPC